METPLLSDCHGSNDDANDAHADAEMMMDQSTSATSWWEEPGSGSIPAPEDLNNRSSTSDEHPSWFSNTFTTTDPI